MSESDEPADTCYRWSCNFIVAHAVLATGLVTAPVAVVHLLRRPQSGAATFFAMFAVFCAAVSSILCCRFYADLKRPPWPRWLSASASGGQQQDHSGAGEDQSTREVSVSHDLRQPELPVMVRVEMQAALATDRIPSYEHRDGGAAVECAVCLGDVEKGETVRQLPACHHVFHRECVDQWLRAHATCPVCRSAVLPERPPEVLVSVEAIHAQPGRLVIPERAHVMLSDQPSMALYWFGPASRHA